MAKAKLLKNVHGHYNYQFNWIDETGTTCGFNSVWAPNKREAKRLAKAMESKAGWRWNNGTEYVPVKKQVTTGGHCFYNKGMYLDVKSMYKATAKERDAMDRLSWMMTC